MFTTIRSTIRPVLHTGLVFGGLLTALAVPAVATAQAFDGPAVSVHAGIFQYDLAGTGTVRHLAVRGDVPVHRLLVIEGSVGYSRPGPRHDERTSFLVPELQAQLQWPVGRVAPYLGVGGGAAMALPGDHQDEFETRVTLSGAGGVRVHLADRLGAVAELRVRGVGTRFEGSTSVWTTGLSWRM